MVKGKLQPLFAGDFAPHSRHHTMLTRLGESGVDAFTVMRIAGHNIRYAHAEGVCNSLKGL